MPKQLVRLFALMALCLVLFSCASSTEIRNKPASLSENSPHSEIIVKGANGTEGRVIALSMQPETAVSKWERIVPAESAGKAVGKLLYSMTPWGVATNLIHKKKFIGMTAVFRTPSGDVNLLVFNYCLRTFKTSTSAADRNRRIENIKNPKKADPMDAPKRVYTYEHAHWGTVLSVRLKPGEKYTLVTKPFATPWSKFEKINACVSLVDSNGQDVVKDYRFLVPIEDVEFELFEKEQSDMVIGDPVNDPVGSSGTSGISGVVIGMEATEILARYMQRYNQFVSDVGRGKYD